MGDGVGDKQQRREEEEEEKLSPALVICGEKAGIVSKHGAKKGKEAQFRHLQVQTAGGGAPSAFLQLSVCSTRISNPTATL